MKEIIFGCLVVIIVNLVACTITIDKTKGPHKHYEAKFCIDTCINNKIEKLRGSSDSLEKSIQTFTRLLDYCQDFMKDESCCKTFYEFTNSYEYEPCEKP